MLVNYQQFTNHIVGGIFGDKQERARAREREREREYKKENERKEE